ncbi:flippase [[Limnothrix rosea] IAM M-220]|uniref:flippase n=1 Tax=[Limnothrix rosea] IAM M-220 TaxID=454133 RepID=UPI00095C8772|nr:flippase [[Limnothrix rosea] IAM M-220]OKH19994.1 flippase [[Limnothrix rosea] IAM M-220]
MPQPQSEPPSLLLQLVRGAGVALVIQIVSSGVIYGSQVLLARWMGAAEYGIYDYVNAVIISFALFAGLGLPSTVLRFVPSYQAHKRWSSLKGIIRSSWLQTVIISLVVTAIASVIWLRLNETRNFEEYVVPMSIGLLATPIVALINLQREIIRGCQKIALAYFPEFILHPFLLACIAGIWQISHTLTSTNALWIFIVSGILIVCVQGFWFLQTLDNSIRDAPPKYEIKQWWGVALPLMLMGGSQIILSQTDTLMIGALLDAKQVGIYGAALKTSAWVKFILMSVNSITAPLIASLYSQGDRRGLQELVSTNARWMFYPALVTAIGLVSFSEPVLQLFGSEFTAAKWALALLIVGQLVNVGSGSVGYLMTMTGHQNQAAKVMFVAAIANAILNWVGIKFFGILGAAFATAFSMSLWNIWLYHLVTKQIGVFPSILDSYRTPSK